MTTSLLADYEDLDEIRYLGVGKTYKFGGIDVTIIEDEFQDESRWFNNYRMVWQENGGKFYSVYHQDAATELQENEPINPSDIEEVEPKEVTVTQYVKKP